MSIGPNIPAADISAAVIANGVPVITDRWPKLPAFYTAFASVVDVDPNTGAPLSDGLYGHRENGIVGGAAGFGKYGRDPDASSMGNDWLRLCALRPVEAAHSFSLEAVRTMLGNGTFGGSAARIVDGLITDIGRVCDQRAADILQKGTLAAGHEVFDQTFEENAYVDPYPLKTYNNCPFFGTQALKMSSATPSNITAVLSLSATNLGTVRQTMGATNNVNERGQKITVIPDTLVVPPGLEGTARTIISSEYTPGTANNDRNWLANSMRIVVNPYLSDDADGWFVLDTKLRPILVLDSGAPVIDVKFEGNKVVMTVKKYFGAAPWAWQGAYAANKATS